MEPTPNNYRARAVKNIGAVESSPCADAAKWPGKDRPSNGWQTVLPYTDDAETNALLPHRSLLKNKQQSPSLSFLYPKRENAQTVRLSVQERKWKKEKHGQRVTFISLLTVQLSLVPNIFECLLISPYSGKNENTLCVILTQESFCNS